MAITLVTGQPGHGKTQWAIAQARKAVSEGRTVYAGNVRGLKYSEAGFIPLDSFDQWEDLPDGSVVLWDECYDAIPQRAPGRAVPKHVEALARHRHRGFDFFLVCQQPKQLDSFVSGLIERHIHVRRKFGTSIVLLKEWDRWERDPDKSTPIVRHTWALDKSIWPLYESATQHTMKRRIPWYLIALPLAIVVVAGAFFGVPALMIDRANSMEASARQTPSNGAQATMLGGGLAAFQSAQQPPTLRETDPLAFMRPRLPGMPWTAPAYDDAPIAEPPRLACVSTPSTCNCYIHGNRQLVKWRTDDELCRIIAREGIYDPIERQENFQPPPVQMPEQHHPRYESKTASRTYVQPYIGDYYRSPDRRASGG